MAANSTVPVQNGTPVNFGFGAGAGITITGMAANLIPLLQSADVTGQADKDVVRGGDGAEVNHSWYNFTRSASLEFVISAASLANAIAATTLLSPGSFITITVCANMPELALAANNVWEIQDGMKISGSNTGNKKVSLPIKHTPGVVAAAS